MEFPLKQDFFPPVRLTSDDRHRYVATAEYSVHVLRKLVADDKWKRISDTKGVTIGKVHCIEEQAYGGNNAAKACLIMCASVITTGAVSEVLEAIASPVTEDYRRAMSFLYMDRFVDGVCLHTISPNGSRNSQAFTTIKWAAFKDGSPMPAYQKIQNTIGTDYCFLEHSGMQKEAHRDESFGFCIQESVARDSEVPVMAGLGLGRGELHRTGILVVPTDRKDMIQISSILQMDTATSLTKVALEKLMMRRVSAVARIPLLLDRRRLSRMHFLPRDHWVRDHERRVCAVCTKTFGLRRKHHCRNCGEVVCATCAPPREVDVSSYGSTHIRICTACVVQSRATSALDKQDDVLVYHVRPSLGSQGSSIQSDDVDLVQDDEPEPLRARKASSADSNFSISSDEEPTFDNDGYDEYHDEDHEDSHVRSIAPDTPKTMDDGMAKRFSEYSEARSSDMSFSEFNTLADDALRITSVPPRGAQQLPPPPPTHEDHFIRRTLYDVDDENRAPNQPIQRRESMDEWFSQRSHALPPAAKKATPPPTPPQQQRQQQREYMDEWCAPRPPSNAASHTSSGSSFTRESMDEWFAPRHRERNHSHASSGSYTHESKRSSSSASSTSSLLEMMSSIREIQNDLAAVHRHDRQKNDPLHRPQMHDAYYLERLSEQLREPEATGSVNRVPAPPTPVLFMDQQPPRPTSRSSNDQNARVSSESSADIDMFNSDSFSLLCPETLQRQRFSSSAQDAGERRSARVSSLSTSTVLEDVEDFDSLRQSELTSLRMQVEGLHRSLEEATNKLNHYTARAAVKQRAESLESETADLESNNRRPRKQSLVTDPVVAGRKQQYHALIEELHEIMGLPALSTRTRSEELLLSELSRHD